MKPQVQKLAEPGPQLQEHEGPGCCRPHCHNTRKVFRDQQCWLLQSGIKTIDPENDEKNQTQRGFYEH